VQFKVTKINYTLTQKHQETLKCIMEHAAKTYLKLRFESLTTGTLH